MKLDPKSVNAIAFLIKQDQADLDFRKEQGYPLSLSELQCEQRFLDSEISSLATNNFLYLCFFQLEMQFSACSLLLGSLLSYLCF